MSGPVPLVFTLDLRVMGGQLCLFGGGASGTRTVVEPYGASVEVGCLDSVGVDT
ncbi:hypothetical protein [Streptomyces sp. NPDC001315]|uniref:hypothetical protein n=1 Tax=Streptomyces sp. NPDC001315 TaxID=3364562 RepID=UPI003673C4F8